MLELLMVLIVSGVIVGFILPEVFDGNYSSLRSIIITTLIAFFYVWIRKENFRYLDVIALFVPLFLSIARITCFLEWHCHGIETNLPWGIVVGGALPVHPTQIYLSLINICLFIIIYNLRKSIFFTKIKGNMVFTYLASYSFLRLVLIEPIRYGVGTSDGFLRSSLLLLMFIVSSMLILIRNRNFYVK